MGFNFPNSPALDDIYTPPGGPTWRWNGYGWTEVTTASSGIEEAPIDAINYVRKNAAWVTLPIDTADWATITGKPSTFPPDAHTHAYNSLTGIPATFPPTLPIASSDVTGLDAAQAAQDTAIGTKLNSSAYTAADVLAKIKTVDGTTSGLDADLLDGNDSAFFATASSVIGKEPTIAAGTAAQYWQGTKTWQTLDKAAVGLANVDNTADASKPVSTAQAAADALALPKAGGTMTGNLLVSKTAPSITLNKAGSGDFGTLYYTSAGVNRWAFYTDTLAESTGNLGSNFVIRNYDDAGGVIGAAVTITRATSAVALTGNLAVSTGNDTGYKLLLAGLTKGIRFTASSTGSSIEGVDQTGSGSFQPLTLNGSTVNAPTAASTTNTTQIATTAFVKSNLPVKVTVASSAPGSPATNDVWIDTT